jgi:hypothetical protein
MKSITLIIIGICIGICISYIIIRKLSLESIVKIKSPECAKPPKNFVIGHMSSPDTNWILPDTATLYFTGSKFENFERAVLFINIENTQLSKIRFENIDPLTGIIQN